VHTTTIRLADGRQLRYYDAAPGADRSALDERDLPAAAAASQLRWDPFARAWVVYASHRQDRGLLPSAAECPLCPSAAGRRTEIPAAAYEVAVLDNRFPALSDPDPGAPAASATAGLLAARPAAGRCEVICFTDEHDASFADLSPERAGLILAALTDRTAELSARPGVEQVFCFENRGREIGVSQPHPHGQVFGYPFVTPRTGAALAAARAHRRRTGRNLVDDVLAAERADGSRVVLATGRWTAFVPHAARWPFEIHLYPDRRVPDLAGLDAAELGELGGVLLDLLGRFGRLFAAPAPYVAAWHQAPVRAGRDLLGLHLELFTPRRASDKLKYLAGSEAAMDTFLCDVLPEAAAARLRGLAP
jgi:UDPglucose--hexose-1-phosphate uridylyltransferase